MTTPAPLEAASKLVPMIRACADEVEALRELPRPLFEALADAGFFHLALPRSLGRPEIDLPAYVEVIEELGRGGYGHLTLLEFEVEENYGQSATYRQALASDIT